MQIEIIGLWVKKNFIQAEMMATKFSGIRHPPSLKTLPHTTLHSLDQLFSWRNSTVHPPQLLHSSPALSFFVSGNKNKLVYQKKIQHATLHVFLFRESRCFWAISHKIFTSSYAEQNSLIPYGSSGWPFVQFGLWCWRWVRCAFFKMFLKYRKRDQQCLISLPPCTWANRQSIARRTSNSETSLCYCQWVETIHSR